MKPLHLTIGSILLAAVSGSGGYFLGKSSAVRSVHSSSAEVSAPYGSISRASGGAGKGRRNEMSLVDLKTLRDSLDREPSPLARFKLATDNLEAWLTVNPREAMGWLRSQQPSERRDEVIRRALAQYAESDPKGAAEWAANNQSGNDLNNSLILIAEQWAEQDGNAAASWFLAQATTPQRDAAIENIFFSWATNEPDAALKYLKQDQALGDLSLILQRAALAGWAKSDPDAAAAASLELSRSSNDPALFANTLANWATLDLEGSSKWLAIHLPNPGEQRQAAVQELASIYAQQSPDAGISWVGSLKDATERDSAASGLAATWARNDAAAAAKWAASETNLKLSPAAATAISENFLREDPAAFEAWRARLPDGTLKTEAAKVTGPEAAEEDLAKP